MAIVVPGSGSTLNAGNKLQTLKVTILTPCFKNFYNEFTDTKPAWFQTVIDDGDWPLLEGDASGTDLGLDLKIQVTTITRN